MNSFGKIDLVPTKSPSLCKGKYAADDGFRLVSFDSSMGTNGDWKPVTADQGRERRFLHEGGEVGRPPTFDQVGVGATCAGALLRWIARSSVPRYDATTRGLLRTPSVRPRR